MKQFKKILGTGLALTQVCMGSCVLGVTPEKSASKNSTASYNYGNRPKDLASTAPKNISKKSTKPQKGSGTAGKIATGLKWTLLALLGADAGLQIACFASSGFAQAWAELIDEEGFGKIIKPGEGLRQLEEYIDKGDYSGAKAYFDENLQEKKLDGGITAAVTLASLGFAPNIYLKRDTYGKWECYYSAIACSPTTSMGIYDRLSLLISKCTKKQASHEAADVNLHKLIAKLVHFKDNFFNDGVPFATWVKTSEYAGKAWKAAKTEFDKFSSNIREGTKKGSSNRSIELSNMSGKQADEVPEMSDEEDFVPPVLEEPEM